METGVALGVPGRSGEDLVMEWAVVDVVFDLMRVVLVPWIVVPLKLVSLAFVLCRIGVGAGDTAIPRADASFESP